jgi:hypothetical protein
MNRVSLLVLCTLLMLDDYLLAIERCRGNTVLDYTQLGLSYKLYLAQLYFNYALCVDTRAAQEALATARRLCDEASTCLIIDESSDDWKSIIKTTEVSNATPFLIPRDAIYRPDERKVMNSENVDYLGESLVIASTTKDFSAKFSYVLLYANHLVVRLFEMLRCQNGKRQKLLRRGFSGALLLMYL